MVIWRVAMHLTLRHYKNRPATCFWITIHKLWTTVINHNWVIVYECKSVWGTQTKWKCESINRVLIKTHNLTITPPNMALPYEKLQNQFASGNWFEERGNGLSQFHCNKWMWKYIFILTHSALCNGHEPTEQC